MTTRTCHFGNTIHLSQANWTPPITSTSEYSNGAQAFIVHVQCTLHVGMCVSVQISVLCLHAIHKTTYMQSFYNQDSLSHLPS